MSGDIAETKGEITPACAGVIILPSSSSHHNKPSLATEKNGKK